MVPDSGIVVADNAPVAHGETVMSKKAKAKTGPREEAGKKSRPMGRLGSCSSSQGRTNRAGVAPVRSPSPERRQGCCREPECPETDAWVPIHENPSRRHRGGQSQNRVVLVRHTLSSCRRGKRSCRGLSRDDARAFAEALVTARVHWWRRALAARIATLRSVHDRLVQFANPPKYMTRSVFRELRRDAEKAADQFAGRWPNTLSNAPEIRPLRTILGFLKDSDRLADKSEQCLCRKRIDPVAGVLRPD